MGRQSLHEQPEITVTPLARNAATSARHFRGPERDVVARSEPCVVEQRLNVDEVGVAIEVKERQAREPAQRADVGGLTRIALEACRSPAKVLAPCGASTHDLAWDGPSAPSAVPPASHLFSGDVPAAEPESQRGRDCDSAERETERELDDPLAQAHLPESHCAGKHQDRDP